MSADQQLAITRASRGESSHLSKAAQKVVPPFLQKLYEIVNDPKHEDLIRWSDNGDSFYVINHERFAREVLGRWFKHQKFTSFVRQLNMYGFHKIPHLQQGVLKSDNDTEAWHFEHPHFHRGQPDLLCLIQRKKQPATGQADDLEMHDTSGPPLGNLTAGQVLDINSIMNGISAIKRHQQAISADLNELKSSNQHLWQEALAARERHKKHQDTINRILKFLAGVFGNSPDAVKHDRAHSPNPVMPRKRQRLMIGDGGDSTKRKAAVVEEVEDDEDDRQSVRSDGARLAPLYATIETPEAVQSPRSPSVTPSIAQSDGFGPTVTDITSHFRPTPAAPLRPVLPSKTESSDGSRPATATISTVPSSNQVNHVLPAYPKIGTPTTSALMQIANGQSQHANADWSATLQNIINSPSQLQQLMQALANQQNLPVPPLPSADPDHNIADPRLATHQITPYDPNAFDFSRFRTELPPNNAQTHASALSPAMLGPLIPKDDDGPSLEPLVENASRLQKTYHDASEIDADVDALQYSLNSLINGLGLDPTNLANTARAADEPMATSPLVSGTEATAPTDGIAADPSSDFDFDAFLNELSTRNDSGPGFTDVTSHFDPTTPLHGTTVGDASTEQLTAFLDDVSSDTASLNEPLDFQQSPKRPSAGTKRKSDAADLPHPPLSGGDPKVKRKR